MSRDDCLGTVPVLPARPAPLDVPRSTVNSTGTLIPPQVPVAVSVAVDGVPRVGQPVSATPDGGGDTVTGDTTAGLFLAPGPWTFAVQDAADPSLLRAN